MTIKGRRKIAGTDYYAIEAYRSQDGSVRHYTLTDDSGRALGNVSSHGACIGRPAGYHKGFSCVTLNSETWPTLATAAKSLQESK